MIWNQKLNNITTSINIIKSVFIFIICVVVLSFAIRDLKLEAFASSMSNDTFIIQQSNLNSFAGNNTGSNYKLSTTGEDNGPGVYSGTNFKVSAGFQYVQSTGSFAFGISPLAIDFGTLSPTDPITRTQTLTIINRSAYGYSVTGIENHPLDGANQSITIHNTNCDDGACTQSVGSIWTNILAYGFGYRCDSVTGNECASGFTDPNSYKQFADASANEKPQAVMIGTNGGKNEQVMITYKVNISATQSGGAYSNTITYVAVPTI